MKAALVSALSLTLLMSATGFEIVAHRGASHDAPENTLASFKLGWEQGADADELDIYLSQDGQVIVMHDDDTKRTTGVKGKIAEQTAEKLRTLDAGSWKGAQWAGEKVPLLAEVLPMIPAGRRLFIEIKCGAEVLPALEEVVRAAKVETARLAIIGFSFDVVKQAKQRFPQVPVYWLASPKKDSHGLAPTAAEMAAQAKAAGLDGLDLNAGFAIDAAFVQTMKAAGLKLYTWTVDDPAVAQKQAALGVDGVTTNRPGWMREQLALTPAGKNAGGK